MSSTNNTETGTKTDELITKFYAERNEWMAKQKIEADRTAAADQNNDAWAKSHAEFKERITLEVNWWKEWQSNLIVEWNTIQIDFRTEREGMQAELEGKQTEREFNWREEWRAKKEVGLAIKRAEEAQQWKADRDEDNKWRDWESDGEDDGEAEQA